MGAASRRDLGTAISGCDYIIYLVHTRIPATRLDQAESENMDLLIADNIARATSIEGIKLIHMVLPKQALFILI